MTTEPAPPPNIASGYAPPKGTPTPSACAAPAVVRHRRHDPNPSRDLSLDRQAAHERSPARASMAEARASRPGHHVSHPQTAAAHRTHRTRAAAVEDAASAADRSSQ